MGYSEIAIQACGIYPRIFLLSASAGLGGSVLLISTSALLLGRNECVAAAALLLAGNNVAKVVGYRCTIPLAPAAILLVMTVLGSALGARP